MVFLINDLRIQIDSDIADRFSISQLCKSQSEELVKTRKLLNVVAAPMAAQ